MHTVAIANQKGGVGKSTTAGALAGGLTARGHRVLLVDLDPQANSTYIYGSAGEPPTVYNVMRGEATAGEAIVRCAQGDLLPANASLAGADIEFSQVGKEHLLREALLPLAERYDYVVLDTPPALGILTVNAFTAAQSLVIPAGADVLSVQGIAQLNRTIELVRTYCNPNIALCGILLTRHNSRTALSRAFHESVQGVAEHLGTFVYETPIRDSVSVREAQAQRESLLAYAPRSTSARDYDAFVDEFLRRA